MLRALLMREVLSDVVVHRIVEQVQAIECGARSVGSQAGEQARQSIRDLDVRGSQTATSVVGDGQDDSTSIRRVRTASHEPSFVQAVDHRGQRRRADSQQLRDFRRRSFDTVDEHERAVLGECELHLRHGVGGHTCDPGSSTCCVGEPGATDFGRVAVEPTVSKPGSGRGVAVVLHRRNGTGHVVAVPNPCMPSQTLRRRLRLEDGRR